MSTNNTYNKMALIVAIDRDTFQTIADTLGKEVYISHDSINPIAREIEPVIIEVPYEQSRELFANMAILDRTLNNVKMLSNGRLQLGSEFTIENNGMAYKLRFIDSEIAKKYNGEKTKILPKSVDDLAQEQAEQSELDKLLKISVPEEVKTQYDQDLGYDTAEIDPEVKNILLDWANSQ